MRDGVRTTGGRGRLFESIIDTVGDTPCIRINNLGPGHVTIYVKAGFFNPGTCGRVPVNPTRVVDSGDEQVYDSLAAAVDATR